MPQHVQPTVQLEVKPSRLNDWLVIALFCLVMLTPLAVQLVGFSTGTSTENRILAPFPKLNSVREIKSLPKMLETYVNDRFGLRQQLVHINSLARYRLGLSSTKEAIIGEDGWLFY